MARSAACTLTLPPDSDASRFVVAANGALNVGDRAIISAPIANMGATQTRIGSDARVGEVTSRAKIELLDRAFVSGNIVTSVPPQRGNQVTLLGSVQTNANLLAGAQQTFLANFPAGPNVDVLLEPDQSAAPAPGRYRHFRAKSRSTLKLSSGTYYLETLEVIEPQAKIQLDESNGPVTLWVNQPFAFRGSVSSNLQTPDWFVGVVQAGDVILESSFKGTVVAAAANLRLATGNTAHTGAFFAKNVAIDPGVVLVHKPSSEITQCSTVLGGVRSDDLPPEATEVAGGPYTPLGQQIPASFLPGVDECVNKVATQDPTPQPDGIPNYVLQDAPSCPNSIEFCNANDQKLSPQPSLQQFLDAPPPGSVCPAIPATDRCFCPVHPASLAGACQTSADCAAGMVCATVCEGPDCAVPRRCGRYVEGCDGLPQETNCEQITVCPNPESVGSVTAAELQAAFAPPTSVVPGPTPQPIPAPTDHFEAADALIAAAREGDGCFFEPVKAKLPVVDGTQSHNTNKGKSNWGITIQPHIGQTNKSRSLEPFGVVLPDFSARAGLDITATMFGIPINVFSANAMAQANLCEAAAKLDIKVGPNLDDAQPENVVTAGAAIEACKNAQSYLERATTLLNWAQAQALAVIDEYETNGPNLLLCQKMNQEFMLGLSCEADPVGSARTIVNTLRDQYLAMAAEAISRASAFASSLAGTGLSPSTYTFFDEVLPVAGGEANFPIGPFVVTVGGSIDANFTVTGVPQFELQTQPGGTSKIGASFTVTPSAGVDATALIGIGFAVITIGVQGKFHLVGVNLPVTAEVAVLSNALNDDRSLAGDGYNYPLLDGQSAYAALRSKKYSWDTEFSMDGDITFDKFLSGTLSAFVRIKLLFFKKTWTRKIVSWQGIDANIAPIHLFDFASELPFSGSVPEFLTAQRFPYVLPPLGAQIVFGTPPTPPGGGSGGSGGSSGSGGGGGSGGGPIIIVPSQSPVAVKKVNSALVQDTTQVLCNPPVPVP